MEAGRHIAQLLSVAIIMIVASLLPSGAHAHTGHAHAPVATAQVAPPVQSDTATKAAEFHAVGAQAVEAVVRATQLQSDSAAMFGCSGSCCGAGMTCCVPAMAPEDCGLPKPTGSASAIVWPETLGLTDVYLEALPKPPPSFA